jgi:glutathione S-transferase
VLDLYFSPLACSLAARIALGEAGLEARYHRVDLGSKTLTEDGGDYRAIAPKGKIPALRLEDGSVLTENVAVLQCLADRWAEARPAPAADAASAYRQTEWLGFVSTELHKGFLYPTFAPESPEETRRHVRANVGAALAHVDASLADRPWLLGDAFSVADAYLVWALVLTRHLGIDFAPWPALASYLERALARPSVAAALAIERALNPEKKR